MAVFPGAPPNPLGFKAEMLSIVSAGVWTDITSFVMLRNFVSITNMGRADESGSITPSTVTLTLKNTDGRFSPKNTGGAYSPNILRNTQIRLSVNATSKTGVAYSGFRFWGEIASWPPGYDVSQRDIYVDITASGIWRRIQSSSVPIGSCYWRYVNLLTGTSVPAAYWSMEDGSGAANFALSGGTGTNMVPTGTPSYAADGASFPGSNALPTMNGARLAANVSSAATPTNNIFRFGLSVPAANDSSFTQFTLNTVATLISSAATIKRVDVTLSSAGQLAINGYTSTAGGSPAFTGTITTKVSGVPVLVSVEITPSGGSINWAMKIIKPNAGTVLDSASGTRASSSITAVTQVQLNPQGRLQDTAIGQMGVWYTVPTLATAASNIGGQAGELAADRITRLCSESNIPLTLIGSGGAACGPQVSDTMANVLTSIEATDGGLLYETTGQFGLGYRTLASMQNQSAALTISYTSGALGAPLDPTYDDQLVHNQWTVTNTPTSYSTTAQLNSGAVSIQPPPNGVGQGYAASKAVNANANAQADAIATQLLKQGTVDDVRFPTVVLNFQRALAGPFFSSVPSLRIGDFFQISNLPAFLGGGTAKQLCWGYTEVIGGEPAPGWTITINAIPELPFETTFNPGSFTVLQGAAGGVPQGSSVGSTVNGSQVGAGAVGGSQASIALSARSVGGVTQFIAAATPYKWSFAVTGTPADATYFICTSVQSLPIAPGDTFSNTGGFGSPFTVTSVDQVGSGVVNVHFTPDASGVMSSGTVQGGTNGDQWVNTSAGNQVNSWGAGVWNAISWNAHNVITAGTITATEILANTITASQIAAGIIIAGVVNGTTISGAQIIAFGTSGEILVYSGTPATGNLIGSWSGASGTDANSNAYPAGLAVEQGGLVLLNQSSAPAGTAGASTFYSSVLGRPRYLSQVGDDSALERSQVSQTNVTMTTQTIATAISQQLTIQSAEANVGSEFEIEIMGQIVPPTGGGSFVANASGPLYTVQIMINGSVTGGVVGWGGVYLLQGTTYTYNVTCRCSIEATGAGGTCTLSTWGTIQQQGPNVGNVMTGSTVEMSQPFSTVGTGKAIDTTTTNTLKIFGFWASVTGLTGHHVTTYRTKTGRRM